MFKCPECRNMKSRITRTRYLAGRPKRWRHCPQCELRWFTLEEVFDPATAVASEPTPPQELYG